MKVVFKPIFILLILFLFIHDVSSQIVINGHKPHRNTIPYRENAITVSYGNVFWVDGKNVPITGYSSSREDFHGLEGRFSIEKMNISNGLNVGFERWISNKLALRAAFYTAELSTGIARRDDLIAKDESRIMQLGLYSSYALTKNSKYRFQFQWLAGPELIYVKKNVLIQDYVEGREAPKPYRQDISILEGAIVTGLGISFRISDAFSLFSDGMVGIAFPGGGFKASSSSLGLKYNW